VFKTVKPKKIHCQSQVIGYNLLDTGRCQL